MVYIFMNICSDETNVLLIFPAMFMWFIHEHLWKLPHVNFHRRQSPLVTDTYTWQVPVWLIIPHRTETSFDQLTIWETWHIYIPSNIIVNSQPIKYTRQLQFSVTWGFSLVHLNFRLVLHVMEYFSMNSS